MIRLVVALALLALARPAHAQPQLIRRGQAVQLMVHGEPFLILGGELSNSAASSPAYIAPVWPRRRAMNLNTVLAPVSWQLIEPREGDFDFSSVDALLADARRNHLH